MLAFAALSLCLLTALPKQTTDPRPVRQAQHWTQLNGGIANPLARSNSRTTVLIFVLTDCPIANAYAPEINRIVARYSPGGIDFYLVYTDQSVPAAAIRKHYSDYGYHCVALLDPERSLAKQVGATISPEAIILSLNHQVVYSGRIDDRVVDFGKVRHQPTRQDLRISLDAILHKTPIPEAHTPCIGCYISTQSKSKP